MKPPLTPISRESPQRQWLRAARDALAVVTGSLGEGAARRNTAELVEEGCR